jgi:hypothetical protein
VTAAARILVAILVVWGLGTASAHSPMGQALQVDGHDVWVTPTLLPALRSAHQHAVADARSEFAPAPLLIAGPQGSRDFEFVCPQGAGGFPRPGSLGTPATPGCPMRFRDEGNSLVNSAVVVDPTDPNRVAIASLHGFAAPDGPRDYSRKSGTHTTHTSLDGGRTWGDQFQQSSYQPTNSAFGADADVTIDSSGQLYIAHLFDNPSVGGGYNSVIQLHRARLDALDPYEGYDSPWTPLQRAPSTISLVHLSHVPSWAGAAEEPVTGDSGPRTMGDLADPNAPATQERVIAVWHASAHEPQATGLPEWIDAAWTGTQSVNEWRQLAAGNRIGPCSDASNPVAWQGKAYVACVVAAGYTAREGARIGEVDLWSIDPDGTTELVGATGVRGGGRPFLSLLEVEDGAILGVLAYTKVMDGDRMVRLETRGAFGWMRTFVGGIPLTAYASPLGPQLRTLGGGQTVPLLDADITAFELIDSSGAALIIYKEWHDDPQIVAPDPTNPAALLANQLMDYNKYLLAFDTCNTIVAGYHVQLGSGVDAFNAQQYQDDPAAFNSVRDGLHVTPTPGGFLAYFSIDDYGSMQYGALRGDSAAASDCFGIAPPVALPAVAIPQGLASSSATSYLAGAVVGAISLSMVGYLLSRRSASTLVSTAKAKRGR